MTFETVFLEKEVRHQSIAGAAIQRTSHHVVVFALQLIGFGVEVEGIRFQDFVTGLQDNLAFEGKPSCLGLNDSPRSVQLGYKMSRAEAVEFNHDRFNHQRCKTLSLSLRQDVDDRGFNRLDISNIFYLF